MNRIISRHLSPPVLILLSFALIILAGTLLLWLPVASVGRSISFLDALFTATSATCVTGLTVIDIGTRLTLFGQLVVLLLIQLGGLGIMTFSTFFAFLVGRRLSIREREILHQTLSQHPMKDIATLLKTVFLFTIVTELLGAIVFWFRFTGEFSPGRAAYVAVFHSVSAFCNAGFSLFRTSFMAYQSDWLVNLNAMFLIVTGGIGFIVIYDILRNLQRKKRGERWRLAFHSKVVLRTTAFLIVAGAVLFFILEFGNSLQSVNWPTKIFISFFQSITARTAGFNTVDIGRLSDAALMLLSLLMLIGASPASCGGGIKTSTFAIVMAMIASRYREEGDVNLLGRRLPEGIVSRAIVITFFSVAIVTLFTLALLGVELTGASHVVTRGRFLEILFESISAFGTVGLSTGITAKLSQTGRVLLIVLMYVGRLGPLTIAVALSGARRRRPAFRYAEDHVLIG